MGGGTEAFPDLGRHCQHKDCNLLDFLPFTCNGCELVFCLEHRSHKAHRCPKSDQNSRKVVVCELCSMSIETTGLDGSNERLAVERHESSGKCDPSKRKKPKCPVKRCKEVLTFSNTSTCKTCQVKVCLKHRFPADHACAKASPAVSPSVVAGGCRNDKFLVALAARNAKDCAESSSRSASSQSASPSVKAC